MPAVEHQLVSVVMPTHDYGRYLESSLKSLQAQSYEHWECIVVDDGSLDDTPIIMRRIRVGDARIRYVRQPKSGPAVARNRALHLAQGSLIQFMDADDLLAPGKLADHVEYLAAHQDVDIVYGDTMYFDDESDHQLHRSMHGATGNQKPVVDGTGTSVVETLLRQNVLTIEAPLTRRSVFDDVGVFDEQLRRMTDWQFWIRCGLAGKRFAYLPTGSPVALIRVHRASLSHDELSMREVEMEMRHGLEPLLPSSTARTLNRRRLVDCQAWLGVDSGLRGDVGIGLRLLVPAALATRRRSFLLWAVALLGVPIPWVRRRLVDRRYGAYRAHRQP